MKTEEKKFDSWKLFLCSRSSAKYYMAIKVITQIIKVKRQVFTRTLAKRW